MPRPYIYGHGLRDIAVRVEFDFAGRRLQRPRSPRDFPRLNKRDECIEWGDFVLAHPSSPAREAFLEHVREDRKRAAVVKSVMDYSQSPAGARCPIPGGVEYSFHYGPPEPTCITFLVCVLLFDLRGGVGAYRGLPYVIFPTRQSIEEAVLEFRVEDVLES